ncbi:MAG: leucine-rich repeat domain-containing protein, partial [Eubacteriales bacterium]
MKKTISLLLATTTLIFTLASCGKNANTPTTGSTSSTSDVVIPSDNNYSLQPGLFTFESITSETGNAIAIKEYTDNVFELTIPDTYTENGVTYTVAKIGIGLGYIVPEYDFNLQRLTILGGKTKMISDSSFQLCQALSVVTIGSGVETIGELAFFNCSSLSTLVLPDTLKKIGAGAFEGTAIKELVIPESVEEIGDNAFANCTSLTKVTIPEKFN